MHLVLIFDEVGRREVFEIIKIFHKVSVHVALMRLVCPLRNVRHIYVLVAAHVPVCCTFELVFSGAFT
jgi:hypothetical protein